MASMSKKTWWILVGALLTAVALAVAGVVGYGVVQQRAAITHAPPLELPEPTPPLTPVSSFEPVGDDEAESLRAALADAADAEELGDVGVEVLDGATGQAIFDKQGDKPLRPASTTKVLTAAAAVTVLGHDDRIETTVVRGEEPGEFVLKAAGDVWLTDARLEDLAAQLKGLGEDVKTIGVDTSIWSGERFLDGWLEEDIDTGFIAPLEPAMLNGGRLGGFEEGDVPRAHEPAEEVANALAEKTGAESAGTVSAPAGAEAVASTLSPLLVDRLRVMMHESDNVMAEAIAREVALARGENADVAGATRATLEALGELGLDVESVDLHDNSGLSVDNRIPAEVLAELFRVAIDNDALRPLLTSLPVGAASGTLAPRFSQEPGGGWVRAKTGSLDETNALAGVVPSEGGHIFAFAVIANDCEVWPARDAIDRIAGILREA